MDFISELFEIPQFPFLNKEFCKTTSFLTKLYNTTYYTLILCNYHVHVLGVIGNRETEISNFMFSIFQKMTTIWVNHIQGKFVEWGMTYF